MKYYDTIYYIADSVFPSQAANSVHVAFQIDSFSRVYDKAILSVLSYEKGYTAEQIKSNYGLRGNPTVLLNFYKKARLALYRKSINDFRRVLGLKSVLVYGRSLIGMYLMTYAGKPLGFEVHTTIWDKNSRNRYFFKKILNSHRLVKLVVISDKLKEIVLEEFGKEYAHKIEVVHDSAPNVSVSLLKPTATTCKHIGYIGSFYKGRGIELILKLAEKLPQKTFHLVGGTLTDLKFSEALPDNIKVYGSLPYTEARDIRLKMDVLLAPYQIGLGTKGGRDTSAYMSPLKVFEYMASKKPMVISDLPVIREILDSNCAILAKPTSLDEWLKALIKLEDSSYAATLANNSYVRFLNQYSWDKRAEILKLALR